MRYLGLFLIFYVVFVEAKSAKTDHAEILVSSTGTSFTIESKSISSQSQFFPFDENTMDFSAKQISKNGRLSFEVLKILREH